MFVFGGLQLTTMPHCGMIPLLLAMQFIGIFPTIEGGIRYAETLKSFCCIFLGTMQKEVSIHDILENARVMLKNSGDIHSDTGEKHSALCILLEMFSTLRFLCTYRVFLLLILSNNNR